MFLELKCQTLSMWVDSIRPFDDVRQFLSNIIYNEFITGMCLTSGKKHSCKSGVDTAKGRTILVQFNNRYIIGYIILVQVLLKFQLIVSR